MKIQLSVEFHENPFVGKRYNEYSRQKDATQESQDEGWVE